MSTLYTYLDSIRSEQLSLLERLVNIHSGTHNKPGVNEIGDVCRAELLALGFHVEVVTQREAGNHLLARKTGISGHEILLVGHLDTVYPKGTPQQRRSSHCWRGPARKLAWRSSTSPPAGDRTATRLPSTRRR